MTGQTNGNSLNLIPKWIESHLFEQVVKRNVKDFRGIKKFVVKPGAGGGENYATLMLKVEIEVELNGENTIAIFEILSVETVI